MAKAEYTVDYAAIGAIAARFGAVPREVENIINSYMHGYAPEKIGAATMPFVPKSNRNKKHARDYQAFGRQENFNLGVRVITSKEFNYLVFPDRALGTSVLNEPQDFTGRGLESVRGDMIAEMNQYIANLLDW